MKTIAELTSFEILLRQFKEASDVEFNKAHEAQLVANTWRAAYIMLESILDKQKENKDGE